MVRLTWTTIRCYIPCLALAIVAMPAPAQAAPAQAAAAPTLVPGQAMPPLRGELLTGRDARLPDVARGKVTLVALGFTYASRVAVEQWSSWFRDRFGQQPDIDCYEVPMMGRAARFGRVFIDRGMRRNTPEALHERVITVYGDTGPWKRLVGFTDADEDDAWLLLVDRAGVVRWLHHGPFDAADASRLASAVDLARVSAAIGSKIPPGGTHRTEDARPRGSHQTQGASGPSLDGADPPL